LNSGGNCEKDQNGNLVLLKDHDESNRALKSILESQRADLAVGLVIGLSSQLTVS
jgi:hypothetical protein